MLDVTKGDSTVRNDGLILDSFNTKRWYIKFYLFVKKNQYNSYG